MTRLASQFPVVVLTGARQTGKTTLLRRLFPQHHYVSLDLPSEAAAAESSPETFFAAHRPPVMVDEVQYAPGVFRHIKRLVDEDRHRSGQFVLTGSQKPHLMKPVSDSLAGRVALLELEGLSAAELAQGGTPFDGVSLTRLLARGSFPELWRDPRIAASDFYKAFVSTYLERDVRQIVNVSSLRDFERFLRLCATYSGQLLNKTELARGVGVNAKTIDQWLGVLHATNQVALLEPYFGNLGKRIVKSPKLYFCDTGLLCFLLGLDESALVQSSQLGAVYETFVYSELRKIVAHHPELSLWFYRDQQGREVDFLVQGRGGFVALECKWTELPDKRDIKWLTEIGGLLEASTPKPTFVRRMVVARPNIRYRLDGAEVVQAWQLGSLWDPQGQ